LPWSLAGKGRVLETRRGEASAAVAAAICNSKCTGDRDKQCRAVREDAARSDELTTATPYN